MTDIPQTGRETCYFCGSEGPLETHHIIPRRHNGSDTRGNLVDLCPTCHARLEQLYDEPIDQLANSNAPSDESLAPRFQPEIPHDTSNEKRNQIKRIIDSLEDEHSGGAPEELLRDRARKTLDLGKSECDRLLDDLRHLGEIYEPHEGRLKVT